MGNNHSSDGHVGARASRAFGRHTDALGLSRSELDLRSKPSGLYPSCEWEERAIRRLIADGKLAARQRGTDTRSSISDRECPICFLHYSQVNMTQCCEAHICTECYLQVRPQKEKSPVCPFCNHPKLVTRVSQTMDAAAIEERQMNEQKVIEAKIRARAAPSVSDTADSKESPATPPTSGFGSSLEQNTTVRLMRARSESLSSADQDHDSDSLSSLALTPEDRRALEDEMRAQHTHPLARQIEREADDRRIENERNYYRSQSGRLRERTGSSRSARMARMSNDSALLGGQRRSSRNWNEIVSAFERGGNGEVNSLDDLVVLEAAILLSMEEESRRRSSDPDAQEGFDPEQHALNGFPLVQHLLSREHSNLGNGPTENQMPRLAHAHNASSAMLLRGISEAEQIEMAIALSLQQSEQQASEANEQMENRERASEPETQETDTRSPEAREATSGQGVARAPSHSDAQEPELPLEATKTSTSDEGVTRATEPSNVAEETSTESARASSEPVESSNTSTSEDAEQRSVSDQDTEGTQADTSDGVPSEQTS